MEGGALTVRAPPSCDAELERERVELRWRAGGGGCRSGLRLGRGRPAIPEHLCNEGCRRCGRVAHERGSHHAAKCVSPFAA